MYISTALTATLTIIANANDYSKHDTARAYSSYCNFDIVRYIWDEDYNQEHEDESNVL